MLNFATSSVEVAPTPATSGASLTVQAGHGTRFVAGKAAVYPASGTIDPTTAEVITITPSGDTLAIGRAQEGTTARAIQAGDVIIQGLTAGMWAALTSATPASVSATQVTGFTATAGTTYPCDASGGAFNATLPTGAPGDAIRVVNTGATGTVTVLPPVAYPTGSSLALTTQWDVTTVQCLTIGSWVEV